MASDIGTVIGKLETAQLDKGETLYVNDAGEFRTAAKGFWSWVSMRSSGFNNDAALVARRITVLVSGIDDLVPHYQRLKPALENFRTRILKAKKQPVKEARSKALEGAIVALSRYSPVPAHREASPLIQVPGSTRSNTPNSSLTPRSDGSGSPHSVRSFGSGVSPRHAPPVFVSQEVSQFDSILNGAVDAAGTEFGFTEREKGQLRQNVAQLYSSGEVVENEEIPLVVRDKARQLATKRNQYHFKYGYFHGLRVRDALEKRFGKIELPEGWVKEQAAVAKTADEFNTILWNETKRLAAKKMADVFTGVCLDAGFSAERLPFSHEKAAMLRLYELEDRILTFFEQPGIRQSVSHIVKHPHILRSFLLEHFSFGNTALNLDEVTRFAERNGLKEYNTPALVAKLNSLFPDRVFRFPAGLITEATVERIKPKQTYLIANEQADGTFEYVGDRNYLGAVSHSPVTESERFMVANRALFAEASRDELLLKQTDELRRHTIAYEEVDSIRPLTEARIREVWVRLLIDAAQERRLLPPNLNRQALESLNARILDAAKDMPIQELGRIARQEIEILK